MHSSAVVEIEVHCVTFFDLTFFFFFNNLNYLLYPLQLHILYGCKWTRHPVASQCGSKEQACFPKCNTIKHCCAAPILNSLAAPTLTVFFLILFCGSLQILLPSFITTVRKQMGNRSA